MHGQSSDFIQLDSQQTDYATDRVYKMFFLGRNFVHGVR